MDGHCAVAGMLNLLIRIQTKNDCCKPLFLFSAGAMRHIFNLFDSSTIVAFRFFQGMKNESLSIQFSGFYFLHKAFRTETIKYSTTRTFKLVQVQSRPIVGQYPGIPTSPRDSSLNKIPCIQSFSSKKIETIVFINKVHTPMQQQPLCEYCRSQFVMLNLCLQSHLTNSRQSINQVVRHLFMDVTHISSK